MLNEIQAADPGTSAILHGMLSTLSEVLGGLDRRLDSIEESVALARHDASVAASKGADGVRQTVLEAVDQLNRRMERLEDRLDEAGTAGRSAESIADALDAGLGEVGRTVAELRGELSRHQSAIIGAVDGSVAIALAEIDQRATAATERAASADEALAGAVRASFARLGELGASVEQMGEQIASVAAGAGQPDLALVEDLQHRVEELALDHRAALVSVQEGATEAVATAVAKASGAVGADLADLSKRVDELRGVTDAVGASLETERVEQRGMLVAVSDAQGSLTEHVVASHQTMADAQRDLVAEAAAAAVTAVLDHQEDVNRPLADAISGVASSLLEARRSADQHAAALSDAIGTTREAIHELAGAGAGTAGGLEELHGAVTQLIASVDAVGSSADSRFVGLDGAVEGLAASIDAVGGKAEERLGGLGDTLERLATAAESVGANVDGRWEAVSTAVGELVSASGRADWRLEGFGTEISRLAGSVDAVHATAEERLAAVAAGFDNLVTVVGGLADKSAAAGLQASIDAIGEGFVAMRATDAVGAEAIHQVARDLHVLSGDRSTLESVEQTLAALVDRVAQFHQAAEERAAGFDALSAAVRDLAGEVEMVAVSTTGANAQLTALLSASTGVSDALAGLREVNDAAAVEVVAGRTATERVAAAVGDLRTLVSGTGDGVADLRQTASASVEVTASMSAHVSEQVASMAALREAVSDMSRWMDALRSTLADHPAIELHHAMADVAGKVDSLVAQPGPGPAMAMIAAGLAERFETRTDELGSSLTSLATTVASAREGMQATAASGAELAAALVERMAATMSAGFGDAAVHDAGVRASLDALTSRLAEDHTDLAGVTTALAELGTSVRRSLDEHAASLDRRVDSSDAALHALAEALGAYQAGVAQLGEAVQGNGGIAETVSAIGERVTNVTAELERAVALSSTSVATSSASVEGALDRVRETIEVQAGSSETVGLALASLIATVDSTSAGVASAVGEGFFDAAARQAAILEAVHRLAGLVEADHGDLGALETAMRTIVTSTERAGTVTGQVAELLLENRAALHDELARLDKAVSEQVKQIAGSAASTEHMVAGLNDQLARLDILVQGLGSRLQSSDEIHALLATIRDEVSDLTSAQTAEAANDQGAEVSDLVHREAELLTQRVAALSVTLEAIRSLMAEHAEETANSIGRKASEVGRKLAGDLGIRAKKPAARRPAESKQLGPPR